MIGFRRFFSRGEDHPLARDEGVSTLLAQLPVGDPTQVLQELTHWLVQLAGDTPLKHRSTKLYRLDQAGQPAERKLREQYVQSSRLNKAVEERIWETVHEFLEASVSAHLRCIAEALEGRRATAELAALAVRAIRRLDLEGHWFQLRYQPMPETWWDEVYTLIRLAEEKGLLHLPVTLNPATGVHSTFVREMLKLLMATVTDARQFTRPQLGLVRHLINALGEHFVWEDMPGTTTVFHVDFSRREPPARLTQTSERHFMARCFGPGDAVQRLVTAMKQVEQGAMPSLLGLGDPTACRRADLLEVLARLAQNWSRSRPLAEHPHYDKRHYQRRSEFLQICVVHGLIAVHQGMVRRPEVPAANPASLVDSLTYDGQVDTHIFGFVRDKTRRQQERLQAMAVPEEEGTGHCESWVVRDVSENGYGVEITSTPGDWIQPNVAVGIRHATGEWQIAVIRRVARPTVENAEVGLEVLSRNPRPAMLRPAASQLSVWETAADTQTYYHTPGILLPSEPGLNDGECLLLEPESYQLHKLYELFVDDGRRTVKLLDRLASYGGMDQVIFAEVKPRPRPL